MGLPYEALSLRRAKYGQEWIRTTEGVKPADLQSAQFGRFGTYPDCLFTPSDRSSGVSIPNVSGEICSGSWTSRPIRCHVLVIVQNRNVGRELILSHGI